MLIAAAFSEHRFWQIINLHPITILLQHLCHSIPLTPPSHQKTTLSSGEDHPFHCCLRWNCSQNWEDWYIAGLTLTVWSGFHPRRAFFVVHDLFWFIKLNWGLGELHTLISLLLIKCRTLTISFVFNTIHPNQLLNQKVFVQVLKKTVIHRGCKCQTRHDYQWAIATWRKEVSLACLLSALS